MIVYDFVRYQRKIDEDGLFDGYLVSFLSFFKPKLN